MTAEEQSEVDKLHAAQMLLAAAERIGKTVPLLMRNKWQWNDKEKTWVPPTPVQAAENTGYTAEQWLDDGWYLDDDGASTHDNLIIDVSSSPTSDTIVENDDANQSTAPAAQPRDPSPPADFAYHDSASTNSQPWSSGTPTWE